MSEAEVIITTRGACGLATLNRPAALNSLTLPMIEAMTAALAGWAVDGAVKSVVIASSGGRAFCAGADIRAMYELGKAGRREEQVAFFRAEYQLDQAIARYPKPLVALVDGIVMGGGAGLSVHAAHCVVGADVTFAMPEVGIGFVPDVGATCFLSRLPGAFGAWMALAGARVGAGDLLALGLATDFAPAARHAAITARLVAGEPPAAAIAAEAEPAPVAAHLAERETIDRCFAGSSLPEIERRLAQETSDFGSRQRAALAEKSPTSLAIALRQLELGAGLELEAALQLELGLAACILAGHDYYEGVRAAIVDKDRRPRWRPATIGEVDPAEIGAYFAAPAPTLEFGAGARVR